jgi:hypothetical protein
MPKDLESTNLLRSETSTTTGVYMAGILLTAGARFISAAVLTTRVFRLFEGIFNGLKENYKLQLIS